MSKRILLIEDDPLLGETLVTMLELLGYEPTLTVDLKSFKATVENQKEWAAIITDYTLPDGNGANVLLHAQNHGVNGVKVVSSGYDKSHFEGQFDNIEDVQWLSKPYKVQDLVSLIS